MPLVLVTGAATESGHVYDDVVGVRYEYPAMYRGMIAAGESFVHYRGRRVAGGGRRPQVYLGCGTVGTAAPVEHSDRWVCAIEDYREFPVPVAFRDGAGHYLEPGGSRRGYFQQGVRRIDDATYAAIVASGLPSGDVDQRSATATAPSYASTAGEALAVEVVSRRVAVRWLRDRPGSGRVVQMPLNNPGYDLRVDRVDGSLFVEVKGTRGGRPRFFLSEGERLFAEANRDRYLLLVVTGVDLGTGAHDAVHVLQAAPTRENAGLREHQWYGELIGP